MHRNTRAHVLSSLAVVLSVAPPTTVTLTAHETVRVDRLAHSEAHGVTASRHGDLLRPGSNTIYLDRGTYHFRTLRDAHLQVTDPDRVMVTTSQSVKCVDPPPLTRSAPDMDMVPGIKGGGAPDHVPALTVSYGDAR